MKFLTLSYNMKLDKDDCNLLRFLCHISKNIYNSALYVLRQQFFNKEHLYTYFELNKIVSKNENFHILNTYMSICTIRNVSSNMEKFIKHNDKTFAQLPQYLDKNGYYTLITDQIRILNENGCQYIELPLSNLVRTNKIFNYQFKDESIRSYLKMKKINAIKILLPKELYNKKIKQLRIVPEYHANYFTVHLSYVDEEIIKENTGNNVMAIDLGVSNLASIVVSNNKSYIIDGKRLKSINQYFNKQMSNLNSKKKPKTPYSKKQLRILRKRNLKVRDYINKSASLIIKIALEEAVEEIVIGYNKLQKNRGIKSELPSKVRKRVNQNFTQLPIFKIIDRIKILGARNNIKITLQEESYTSLCSFYDNEEVKKQEEYQGRRDRRLFYTKRGKIVNSDINAALNILTKSKPKDDELVHYLRNRGLTVPLRVQVALS